MSVPLSLWLFLTGFREWRSGATRRVAVALALGLPVLTWFVVGLSLLDYHAPAHHGALARTLGSFLRTTFQALSMALGSAGERIWPCSAGLVALFFVVGAGLLLVRWRHEPGDRVRVIGLGCFLGGVVLVALSIGWGRAPLGDRFGFSNRYGLLIAPGLLAVYFIALGARAPGRVMQIALLLLLLVAQRPDFRAGLQYARLRQDLAHALMAEATPGASMADLAEHFAGRLWYDDRKEQMEEYFNLLHDAGVSPYDRLVPSRNVAR